MKRKLCCMIGMILVFFFSFVLLQGCSDPPCKTARDCPSKQICSATGACQPGCVTNQDCTSGKQCSVQGRCIDTAEEGSTTVVIDASTSEGPPEKAPSACKEGQTIPCFDGKPGLEVVGVCKSGQKACVAGVWGPCIGQVLPSNEICDNKDNDCNGQVDENITNCGCKRNEDCPAAKPNCQAGQCIRFCQKNEDCGNTDSCKDGYCQICADGGDRSKKEECNGRDDDCDGQMDEGLTKVCGSSNVGACKKGQQFCTQGSWNICVGEVKATTEVCDGKDNDCDGQTDEGLSSCFLPAQIKLHKKLMGHTRTVDSLVLSNDGKTLFSGGRDRTIKQWDLATGKLLRTFSGHKNNIHSLLTTPDGKTLISLDYLFTKLWNIQTGTNTATLGFGSHVATLSKDGKQLFVENPDWGDIDIWDISTQKKLKALKGHTDSIYKLVVSPDGKTLASGDHYSTIKLWDIQTGKVLHTLAGHKGAIRGIDFRADGKVLATGGGDQDRTIKLWDVQTGKNTHTLTGHASSTYVVKFSPNGKHLLSASYDHTVRIWNPTTAKQIRIISAGTSRYPYTALWSKDGTAIIFAGDGDYGIQIWK